MLGRERGGVKKAGCVGGMCGGGGSRMMILRTETDVSSPRVCMYMGRRVLSLQFTDVTRACGGVFYLNNMFFVAFWERFYLPPGDAHELGHDFGEAEGHGVLDLKLQPLHLVEAQGLEAPPVPLRCKGPGGGEGRE